jgi:TrmH family RNA methyltransferase
MTTSSWSSVVENVRRALAPKGRVQLGQFVIEGVRLVERALRAGAPPRQLVISEKLLRHRDQRLAEVLSRLEHEACEVIAVPEGVVLELAEGRNAGMLFGLCDLPRNATIAELVQHAELGAGPILVLVDVAEPGNVGALSRTALASGASGLVAVGVSDPFHPKAVRTSMGSIFKLPIVRGVPSSEVLSLLDGIRCMGAVAQGGRAPWDVDLSGACAILLGSEGNGLNPEITASLSERLTIPMPGSVDSFSVNAAAAILMYEASRQLAQRRSSK